MNDKIFKNKDKPEELIPIKQLIDEGKLDEADQLIQNFEEKEGHTLHDLVLSHLLKCELLLLQGLYETLVKLAEQTYKESLGLGKNLLSVDLLLKMANALLWLNQFDKFHDIIKQGEELLKALPQELPADYKQREAYVDWLKGRFYFEIRDADRALKHLEHSLALREELGNKQEIAVSLGVIGRVFISLKVDYDRALKYYERGMTIAEESGNKWYIGNFYYYMAIVHQVKGELERSIKLYKQGLTIFNDINNKYMVAAILINLGEVYRQRGELDRALECLEQALALRYERRNLRDIAIVLDYLIQILLDKGDLERAQQYLHRYEQLNNQLKDKKLNLMYLLNKALMLKTSPRALNRGKAEEILKQILEDEDSDFELILKALPSLCELLLTELRMTNDLEVLDEINPLIARLLDIAEKTGSYSILSETHLLQAKLSLLTFNIKKAKRFLTQAQQIAERFGLNQLAIKISNEHDELLKQLSMWENLKELKAPLKKRIELARLNDQVVQMLKKHMVEPPKLEAEQPVLIAIMTKEGDLILSSPFTADMTIDESHFGEFLSSCNEFCEQIFSESFDRVKFGRYTILITAVEPFCIYYMFQGHSYSAQNKLDHFCENLKKDSSLMETLKNAVNVNEVLEINKHPSLENLIVESFLSDPQKFQMPFKAYEGDEPFIFASYSHTDKLQVYPIIDYLNKKGIHIWYDEGIPISENWKKSIVENLERCKAFLLFITPHILDSDYVRKEISFASKRQKTFFGVYLKETELPRELEFDIADIQSMKKYLMSDSDFYPKLREVILPALYEHEKV